MKKGKIPKSLEKEYKSLEPILNKGLAELRRIIKTQLGNVQNPRLVRIRLTEARVKSLTSLWEKAQKRKWKVPDILREAKDLLGFRIVCANLEDIYRVKELLLSNPRLKEIPNSKENRTIVPTPSGYRDFKFFISYETYETMDAQFKSIPCEIQIRTVLQDSWATLVHRDIYKEGDNLPDSLKKLSCRLSELLHVADQIAQDIREEVSKRGEPLKCRGKMITEDTLQILYKKVFKELPPDYLVRLVKNKCEELGILNIKPLEEALLSKKNIKLLKKAYAKTTGWNINNELIFQVSPLIAVYGINVAVDSATKNGKQEWEDIDQIYRREIATELPDTFEEFLAYLEPHTKDDYSDFPDRIYRLGEIFNAIEGCSICGAPIVDKEIFSQNAQEYYGVEDLEGEIESLVLQSGIDVGEGSLCSYHAYHKDD